MKCNNHSLKMQTVASRRPAGLRVRVGEGGAQWRKWFIVWYLCCIMGSSGELLGTDWLNAGLDGCLVCSRLCPRCFCHCCPRLKRLAHHEKQLSENRQRGCAHTHMKGRQAWFNISWQCIRGHGETRKYQNPRREKTQAAEMCLKGIQERY